MSENLLEPMGPIRTLDNTELSVIYLPDFATKEAKFQRFFVGYPEHIETYENTEIIRFRNLIYLGAIEQKDGTFKYMMNTGNSDYCRSSGRLCEAINGFAKPLDEEPTIIKDRVREVLTTIINSPERFSIKNQKRGINKDINLEEFLSNALDNLDKDNPNYPKDERINVRFPNLSLFRYAPVSEVTVTGLTSITTNPEQIHVGYKDDKLGTFILSNFRMDKDNNKLRFKSTLVIDSNKKVKANYYCSEIVNKFNNQDIIKKILFVEVINFSKSSELFGYRNVKKLMVNKVFNNVSIKYKFTCAKDGIKRDIVEIYHPEIKKNIKFVASDLKFYTINIDNITKGITPKKDRRVDINTKVYISPKVARVYNLPKKSVATVKLIDFSKQTEFVSKQTGKKVNNFQDCYAQVLVDGNQKDVICKIKDLKRI